MKIIFDIETVRAYRQLEDAPESFRAAWEYTCKSKFPDEEPAAAFLKSGNFYPEFGRILCISAINDQTKKVVSFAHATDELSILASFADYLGDYREELIGHSVKYFDIPYVVARMAAHAVKLPPSLRMYGVKPWESNVTDTHEVWKCGFYSTTNAGSLAAICNCLGIESPKDDMSGGDVADVFYNFADHGFATQSDAVDAIAVYCEKDVAATAKVFNHMKKIGMI